MAECPGDGSSSSYRANFEAVPGVSLRNASVECAIYDYLSPLPVSSSSPNIARETAKEPGRMVLNDRDTHLHQSPSDLSIPDSGVSSISSAHFRCPCGHASIRHLMRRSPSCHFRNGSKSYPELDLQHHTKAQQSVNRQLKMQTEKIRQQYVNLMTYATLYLESFPGIEKILRVRLNSRNETVAQTLEFEELLDLELKGSSFITFQALKDLLKVCFAEDTTHHRMSDQRKRAEDLLISYENEFKSFAENRVFSLPGQMQLFSRATHEGIELRIKIEEDSQTFTLDRIDYFEAIVREILDIPPHVYLNVVSVQSGCVEITFDCRGATDDPDTLSKEQKLALAKKNITLLEFNGKIHYCCCDLLGDSASEELIQSVYLKAAESSEKNLEELENHTLECSQKKIRISCQTEICHFCNEEFNSCQMKYHQFECKDMVLLSDGSSLSFSESDEICDFANLSLSSGIASDGYIPEVVNPEVISDIESYQHGHPCPSNDCISLANLLNDHKKNFPVRVEICQGMCGTDENSSFSRGDQLKVHFSKSVKCVAFEYENHQQSSFNVPENSPFQFALLYNPLNNIEQAQKGYEFEAVADVLKMNTIPYILRVTKRIRQSRFERYTSESVVESELLIVKNKMMPRSKNRRKSLKVLSFQPGRVSATNKVLAADCIGPFSTKPQDVKLNLAEIIKYFPDISTGSFVMFDKRQGDKPVIVKMLHRTIEQRLVVTNAHEPKPNYLHELPATLDICVRLLDSEPQTCKHCPLNDNYSLAFDRKTYTTVRDDGSQRPQLAIPHDLNEKPREYTYVKNHPRTTRPCVSSSSLRPAPEKPHELLAPSPSVSGANAADTSSFGSTGSGGADVISRRNSGIPSGSGEIKSATSTVGEDNQNLKQCYQHSIPIRNTMTRESKSKKRLDTFKEDLVPEVVYGTFTNGGLGEYSIYDVIRDRGYGAHASHEPGSTYHSHSFSTPSRNTSKSPHTFHNTL